MKIKAKKIRIEFNNSSEGYWEASCGSGLEFDEAIRMITRAWGEHDAPAEPLIKDEKIREAVRAWWECCQEGISDKRVRIINGEFRIGIYRLDLGRHYFFDDKKEGFYTIAELCGEEEAPEPIEPTFVDLDERVKEKEEEEE